MAVFHIWNIDRSWEIVYQKANLAKASRCQGSFEEKMINLSRGKCFPHPATQVASLSQAQKGWS